MAQGFLCRSLRVAKGFICGIPLWCEDVLLHVERRRGSIFAQGPLPTFTSTSHPFRTFDRCDICVGKMVVAYAVHH